MKAFSLFFVNSLKVRLMVSILAMIMVILPIIAVIIVNSFEEHTVRSIKNELSAYSYSILAVAEVEQANLVMPETLIENQFNVSSSGLYAFISGGTNNQAKRNEINPHTPRTILWVDE